MIQTGATEKRSVRFRVLSDDQIAEIKRAAFEVMSKVGFRVLHEGARKMFKQAGALVNGDNVKVELTPYDLTKGRITFRE